MQTVQTEYFFSDTWLAFFSCTVTKFDKAKVVTLSYLNSLHKAQTVQNHYALFCLVYWAWPWVTLGGKNAHMKFFLHVFLCIMHNHNCHIKPDILTITSTHHSIHAALRISNALWSSVIFPYTLLFWPDRSHNPTPIWNYILHTKNWKCTLRMTPVKFVSTFSNSFYLRSFPSIALCIPTVHNFMHALKKWQHISWRLNLAMEVNCHFLKNEYGDLSFFSVVLNWVNEFLCVK